MQLTLALLVNLPQPLARLGADVTGVDASARNINSALQHSSSDPLIAGKLHYSCTTVENLADTTPEAFDAVISSEVIEHVTDKKTFLEASAQLIKVMQDLKERRGEENRGEERRGEERRGGFITDICRWNLEL